MYGFQYKFWNSQGLNEGLHSKLYFSDVSAENEARIYLNEIIPGSKNYQYKIIEFEIFESNSINFIKSEC